MLGAPTLFDCPWNSARVSSKPVWLAVKPKLRRPVAASGAGMGQLGSQALCCSLTRPGNSTTRVKRIPRSNTSRRKLSRSSSAPAINAAAARIARQANLRDVRNFRVAFLFLMFFPRSLLLLTLAKEWSRDMRAAYEAAQPGNLKNRRLHVLNCRRKIEMPAPGDASLYAGSVVQEGCVAGDVLQVLIVSTRWDVGTAFFDGQIEKQAVAQHDVP